MSTQKQSDIAVAEKVNIEEVPRFNVIAHNNDITSYEEVVFIITKVFNKSENEAFEIANTVHNKGKGICGTYDKEVAEVKLYTVDLAKQYLIQRFPHRAEPINALKFTMEEAK